MVAQCCHHISISAEFNFSLGANITTWVQILPGGNVCAQAVMFAPK
jgi:hypothetical protein